MYKVETIQIEGFWGDQKTSSKFRDGVNIIIGKNGTGKTTFMNILHAVLAVDTEALFENYFKSVDITLFDGKRRRKVSAKRIEADNQLWTFIEYKISTSKYVVPLLGGDVLRTLAPTQRKRALENALLVKNSLSEFVSLASLSVYRIGGDIDPEIREKNARKLYSPVDQRLASLTQKLTQYQLELSNDARKISAALQRDVLTSILYTKDSEKNKGFSLNFDVELEKQKLVSAYSQLGVSGSETTKKIQEHVKAVSDAISEIGRKDSNPKSSRGIDLSALEAFNRTSRVVDLSLDAEKQINELFSQITLFIDTLSEFIPDKLFKFDSGELAVSAPGEITLAKLSSGEKQLLILFIESLLQKRRPYIFLADEPELSLHISWQRKIISAINALNPSAQIIVATHSPEIAGKYRDAILDMEDIRNG